jgi:D-xylonolactonase
MSENLNNKTESIERLCFLACDIAENPLWHKETNKLYFVDIPAGTIYSYDPAKNNCCVFAHTRITGGFTLQRDGSLLLFQDGGITSLALDGTLRELASSCCPDNERFNDVIADPEGRVFAGAMGGNGRLFRVDTDGHITEMFDGFGGPNGMGFTPDLRGMYFTDSPERKIYYFDYDRETGNLSNRRTFAEIPAEEGLPDGMTVDTEGYLWSAIWFGGRLKRYAPDGKLDREVFLPVQQTSSLTFGGPELNEIYVTSAASTVADSHRPPRWDSQSQRGGDLYRVRVPKMHGRPPFRSSIEF